MLISCPKCHSIYEIPDDLIPRTGQNFRCQACANVWHALREDAIGYKAEVESDDKPYIEAITVKEPPMREYPANKQKFTVPADTKSGRRTRSSKEIIARESTPDYVPPAPTVAPKKELTLTSDLGTAFTISTEPTYEEDKPTPRFFDEASHGLSAKIDDRLLPEKTFKGCKKAYLLLFVLSLAALALFFRREAVAIYPQAEIYYNKIGLSGLNNSTYLKFENITVSETIQEHKPVLKINATIYNDSFYRTVVPEVALNGVKETFSPSRSLLKAHEKTNVEINLPVNNGTAQNLTLFFQKN